MLNHFKKGIFWAYLLILSFANLGCHKKPIPYNPCQTGVKPKPVVSVQAMLRDSAYASDTIFNNNQPIFSTPETYDQYYWNIGSDPRTFNSQKLSLVFAEYTGSVLVKFRGQKAPNTLCFPGDDGMYEDTQRVVFVSQFTPPITISPLRGKYKGAFDDTRYDSIEFSIDYYDSAKYNKSYTGSQQFYWLNGFPNGYYNYSSTALVYPELRNGMKMSIGYRFFEAGAQDMEASYGRIKGWLVNDDTLIILTKYQSESYRRFVALRKE